MLTLGIETSCDETSVAVLRDGAPLVSKTYTQLEHSRFGGVVPEVASRAHLRKIDILATQVLDESGHSAADMDLIAVTDGPGLAGALLVGISFALGLHRAHETPITGIHHLEGHICAALLEHDDLGYPFVALVVSGGHTALYRVDDIGAYECLGQTVDDAAGEAFDKVGKLLGFPYPAGRAIDEEAQRCDCELSATFPVTVSTTIPVTFSFSGLKTAVKYYLADKSPDFVEQNRPCICRAFEKAVVEALVRNTLAVTSQSGIQRVICSGGVAANGMLRHELGRALGKHVYFPSPALCTDNAAMIARAGFERSKRSMLAAPRMSPSKPL